MSSFTGEGFAPFPNVYSDNQRLGECSEWPDSVIEDKVCEYWQFLDRDDIMPRAIAAAHRVIDHLGFEMDYRYGAYETTQRLEDEVCDAE